MNTSQFTVLTLSILFILLLFIVFKSRHKISTLLTASPAFLGLFMILLFIRENYFSSVTCDVEDGCMNETGMLLFLAIYLFLITGVIFVLTLVIRKVFSTMQQP